MIFLTIVAGAAMGQSVVTEPSVRQEIESEMKVLVDFENEAPAWRIIDDGVMGGLSAGNWQVEDGAGVFSGTLSLENNGGFSSVRSESIPGCCDEGSAFRLRVRGDGRAYQFRVRTTDSFDGVSYKAEFSTVAKEWQTVELSLKDFVPSFRGRIVENYPPLKGKNVVTIGFLLADKKAGPFRLEVDWIGVVAPTGDA